MRLRSLALLAVAVAAPLPAVAAPQWKAGLGRVDITPQRPIWMSGYASRNHPSEGVLQKLWAKALALEDAKGRRAVIVTTDLVGLPRALVTVVVSRAQQQYKLDPNGLVLNSSHTHTGPVIRANLATMYNFSPEQDAVVQEYSRQLVDNLVTVIGDAIKDLAPAQIAYGTGEAGFAMNRRQQTEKGVIIGVNPSGPTDHTVPVIRITAPDGKLRGVLFAYACHNTTLTGEFYQLSGDYAGFAQAEFEGSHPGTTALFMMLCGGDQNPNPRSSLDLAKSHGKELAGAVEKVLASGTAMQAIRPQIAASARTVDLALSPHTRETFAQMQSDSNVYRQRLAKAMLQQYDAGHPVRTVLYPVQAIRLGKDVTLVALGGEVVMDYNLRLKREYPREKLIVAGYCNDVMCYIPSRRVRREGGYEAVDSMMYYGQPTPFTEDVEDSIFAALYPTLARVGVKK
jgi:neutral ceramidase